jgi:RNA polymerase sigma factor (sigma-70 family)
MNEKSDRELLQAYASEKSEAAFAELVQRHIHLVYSAAVRLVVDPHLAEDVAQAAFVALARNAGKLAARDVLSSWLMVTTRNLAAKTVRTEERRRSREKEAAAMQIEYSEPDDLWERIAPQLDDALSQLDEIDRDALALRFFERKTAREMGLRLGLSEEAAQKRVTRALERLRGVFVERGLAVPSAALAGAISVQAVQPAPVGLAAAITGAALASAPVTGGSTLILLKTMTGIKMKATVLGVILVGGLATTIITQQAKHARLLAENAALKQKAESAMGLEQENEQLRAAQQAAALADPAAAETLKRERAAAAGERAKLLRLRNEVGTRLRQGQDRKDLAAQEALKDTLARELAWSEVPPAQIKLEPAQGRFELASAQNAGAKTPESALTTWLWALRRQDPEALANLLSTPDQRTAFDMPTNDIASALDGLTNFTGVSALILRSKEAHGDGQVRLRYDFEYDSQRSQAESGRGYLQLKKVRGEWYINGEVRYPRGGIWPR